MQKWGAGGRKAGAKSKSNGKEGKERKEEKKCEGDTLRQAERW